MAEIAMKHFAELGRFVRFINDMRCVELEREKCLNHFFIGVHADLICSRLGVSKSLADRSDIRPEVLGLAQKTYRLASCQTLFKASNEVL